MKRLKAVPTRRNGRQMCLPAGSTLRGGPCRSVLLLCATIIPLLLTSCEGPSLHFRQSKGAAQIPTRSSDNSAKEVSPVEALPPASLEMACAADGTVNLGGHVFRSSQLERFAAVASTNLGNVYELDMSLDADLPWSRLVPLMSTFAHRGVQRMALIIEADDKRTIKVPVFVVSGTPIAATSWRPPSSANVFRLTSRGVVRGDAVLSPTEIGAFAASSFESVYVISAEPTVTMSQVARVLDTLCRGRTVSICLDLELRTGDMPTGVTLTP